MGPLSSDRIFPVNMETIANMADIVVFTPMSLSVSFKQKTKNASTDFALTNMIYHWNLTCQSSPPVKNTIFKPVVTLQ
jgi:hypothetical protein